MRSDTVDIDSLLEDGMRRYRDGNVREALWDFFHAAGKDPENPLAHYLSGLGLRALGMEDEARAEWRQVLSLTLHHAAFAETIGEAAVPDDACRWASAMALKLLNTCPDKASVKKSDALRI